MERQKYALILQIRKEKEMNKMFKSLIESLQINDTDLTKQLTSIDYL